MVAVVAVTLREFNESRLSSLLRHLTTAQNARSELALDGERALMGEQLDSPCFDEESAVGTLINGEPKHQFNDG